MNRLKMISVFFTLMLVVTSFNFPVNRGQNVLIFKLFNSSNNKYCTIVEIVNVETKKKYKSSWMFFNEGFSTINKVPAGTYYISKAYYIAGNYRNGFKFPASSVHFVVSNQGVQYFGEYKLSKNGMLQVSKTAENENLKLLSNWINTEEKTLGWTFNEHINYSPIK